LQWRLSQVTEQPSNPAADPKVEETYSQALEILGITRHKRKVMLFSRCGDEGIHGGNRPANGQSTRHVPPPKIGGFDIDRKHAPLSKRPGNSSVSQASNRLRRAPAGILSIRGRNSANVTTLMKI
jgi:hypothetical protein